MKEQKDIYNHVEVDIVYRGNGVFDVTHDEEISYNLHLDSYFAEIKKDSSKLWLDIKNVTLSNCFEMKEELNKLCTFYGINKNQLIIEGGNPLALETFTKDEYYTSYYVPFDKPSNLSNTEIDSCISTLQGIVDSHKTQAISFPGWWYNTIKAKLNRSIDLLTWKHRTTQLEFFLSPKHFQMLKDPQLKVILIKSKGKYHR